MERGNLFKSVVRKLFFSEVKSAKKDKSWEKNMFAEMNRLRGRIVVMKSR